MNIPCDTISALIFAPVLSQNVVSQIGMLFFVKILKDGSGGGQVFCTTVYSREVDRKHEVKHASCARGFRPQMLATNLDVPLFFRSSAP